MELGPPSHQTSPAGSQDSDHTDDGHTDGDHTDGDEDNEDDGEEDTDGDSLRTSAATSAVPSASSTPRGQKQKFMADSIIKVSACERENQIKIAKINATAKTERSNQRESIKRRTNLELELARMQHQRDEAAAQRAHEAAMFDRQASLEMARAGQAEYGVGGPHDAIHPSLR